MNRRHMLTAGAAVVVALPLATAAQAQMSAMMADGTMDPEKAPAILNGNYARASSLLALEKATNGPVRTFAQLEAAEQTATAMAFGVPADAPLAVPADKAATMQQLQAASGAEFDRLYVQDQITGHQELRTIHSSYAANGSDPMARGASMVGVTSIDSHLVMLRAIQASLGA